MPLLVWLLAAVVLAQAAAEPSRARILAETIPGSVPPEFAADLLIRIADSAPGQKESADWRSALYEQAFELAGAAPNSAPYFRLAGPADMRTAVIARQRSLVVRWSASGPPTPQGPSRVSSPLPTASTRVAGSCWHC